MAVETDMYDYFSFIVISSKIILELILNKFPFENNYSLQIKLIFSMSRLLRTTLFLCLTFETHISKYNPEVIIEIVLNTLNANAQHPEPPLFYCIQ